MTTPAPPAPPGAPSGVRVLAEPAFRTREANPYNARLYTELQALGVQVDRLRFGQMARRPPLIVHLHWPELTFLSGHRRSLVLARLASFYASLALARRRGTKVIWTVHNADPHEQRWPTWLTSLFWRTFTARVDGLLGLSQAGLDAVVQRHPRLAGVPAFVTPHGDYTADYDWAPSREQARRRLGLASEQQVVTFVGQVRPYKQVSQLVRAFAALPGGDLRLRVSGAASSPQLVAELTGLAEPDARIALELTFQEDSRMVDNLRAADLVVLPYGKVLNSGSALLALSAGRPVLLPAIGAMGELAEAVGPDWVRTYEGELTSDELSAALVWALRPRAADAPLSAFRWPTIAALTLQAYERIGGLASTPQDV